MNQKVDYCRLIIGLRTQNKRVQTSVPLLRHFRTNTLEWDVVLCLSRCQMWYYAHHSTEWEECNTMATILNINRCFSSSNTRQFTCSRCEGVYCSDCIQFSCSHRSKRERERERERGERRERERERERELLRVMNRDTFAPTQSLNPCRSLEGLCGSQLYLNSKSNDIWQLNSSTD